MLKLYNKGFTLDVIILFVAVTALVGYSLYVVLIQGEVSQEDLAETRAVFAELEQDLFQVAENVTEMMPENVESDYINRCFYANSSKHNRGDLYCFNVLGLFVEIDNTTKALDSANRLVNLVNAEMAYLGYTGASNTPYLSPNGTTVIKDDDSSRLSKSPTRCRTYLRYPSTHYGSYDFNYDYSEDDLVYVLDCGSESLEYLY